MTNILPKPSPPESPVNTRRSLAPRGHHSDNKPSPVANLSRQTSNLSLDSPSTNTRSRQSIQKPVAFTIEAPAPVRRAVKQPCKVNIHFNYALTRDGIPLKKLTIFYCESFALRILLRILQILMGEDFKFADFNFFTRIRKIRTESCRFGLLI